MAQLQRLDDIFRRRALRITAVDIFDAQHVEYRDVVCWWFSKPERARFGMLSPATVELLIRLGGNRYIYEKLMERYFKQSLGTLNQNLDIANAYFAHHKAQALLPYSQHALVPLVLKAQVERYLPARIFLPEPIWVISGAGISAQLRDSIALRLDIERFHAAHDRYPASLDELTLSIPVPINLLSGQTSLYKRVDPATDIFKHSYLLYLAGPDGTDNQGARAPMEPGMPYLKLVWSRLPSGTDYIINDPDR